MTLYLPQSDVESIAWRVNFENKGFNTIST